MAVKRTGASIDLPNRARRSREQPSGAHDGVEVDAGPAKAAHVDEAGRKALLRCLEVRRKAQRILGEREWVFLSSYGKLMEGPHSGTYVSGLPCHKQLKLVHRLRSGETVLVHLMHRHKSGDYEASSLRWTPTGFMMVFADREVQA